MSSLSVHESFPLAWPASYPRTKTRDPGRFQVGRTTATQGIQHELRLMGAYSIVVTTNLPTRRDGLLYANTPEPEDPGVAVYWALYEKPGSPHSDQYVIAGDAFTTVAANLQAVRLTIQAIRSIDRYGTSRSLKQAFAGFKALPAASTWRSLLGPDVRTKAEAQAQYRTLARQHHPDAGGSHLSMAALNEAIEAAMRELEA